MAKKMHTRAKRKLGVASHRSHQRNTQPNLKPHGLKTFKTKESASAWAKKQGLATEKYTIIKAKHGKKFAVSQKSS
ncbi:hypothetical protein CL622_00750 [archaeon]|nr:hypothetical protein [archaeon]|tara:strand:+ start:115 stop:342 length:228 start_codon:yes stop_codon:yes gene_type:complete